MAAVAAEPPGPAPAAVTLPAPPRQLDPRPHYIVAGISAGVECAIALAWLLLRPVSHGVALALLLLATLAGSALVGAAAFISSGKPMPERKA